jgi:polyphosphate kinase 2
MSKNEKKDKKNHRQDVELQSKSPAIKNDIDKTDNTSLSSKHYSHELEALDLELIHMQQWAQKTGARIVVIFEGRDGAGKGGVIKRIAEPLNPRFCRIAALGVPTEKEKTQWYFQRYVAHLPAAGEIVLFDRSWYNRAGVEHIMGFCTTREYEAFLKDCPDFETMLIRSGIHLVKFWFSVSDLEQEKRFQERATNPLKQWKLSPMDIKARDLWVEYSRAKDRMFATTDTDLSPWYVVDADNKQKARLNCIRHLLSLIPYAREAVEPITLPPRRIPSETYVRPPLSSQRMVPDYYG